MMLPLLSTANLLTLIMSTNDDDDDFQRFVGFWMFLLQKHTQLGPLASMTLPFAVYDQPARPWDVNEDYDDFKLFLGFQDV